VETAEDIEWRNEVHAALERGEKTENKTRKKPAKTSPTQRSLKELRKRGYLCAIVEKWNMHARIRQDMFGFVDIVAIKGEDIIGVQACVGSSVSDRVTKIVEHENYATVSAAMRITVHGWRKSAAGKWTLREVEL
jgi:hypothetical protein